MKELTKSQYLYLKSKKNAILRNEIIEIEDEEYDDLIQYNSQVMPIEYRNELSDKIEELEIIIESMQTEIESMKETTDNARIDALENSVESMQTEIESMKETTDNARIDALEQDMEAIKEVAYDEVNIDNGVLDLTEIK